MDNQLALGRAELESRHFIVKVYNWMALGLAVTGLVSLYMVANPQMIVNLVRTPFLFYGLVIGELVLVFGLSAGISRMSASTAACAFTFYAALTGVTMSVIFLAYTSSSIASTFFVTAGTFGVMSAYGYATKTDLTGVGNICFMGLVGVILASLANFFLRSPAVSWVTTYISIAVFTGLTAYDTQKLKGLIAGSDGSEEERKGAIIGALSLYLDFINLFLSLLRVMGKRRS